MSKNNAQEQIIAKLKESESILIAVNDSPSVDELSSALALTLAINNSGKHATAVASGEMPDALTFLRPEKTFEHSVDSLRDFIIALNKEKADHLRYKLVGDHVKIFITPYRSVISEKDLEFEQGDFNIDFVLALNVESQDRLDGALAAHGRIFHDASVGILTVGENQTNLNGTHWHAENASSLSELAVQIIESLGKKNLTQPVATALLTGIVAETDRFSNVKAMAEVMSLAAKLISSGADQQLVVSKIREAEEKAGEFAVQKNAKMEEALEELSGEKEERKQVSKTEQKRDGAFVIAHEEAKDEAENENAEDELEESLNELKNINTPENAFAELEKAETFGQNQETSQGSSNEEIFEDPSKDFKEEQSQNENSVQNSIENQEILADQNVPTFENSQPQIFETTEPQITQSEVTPVFEQQNPAEIPAQPEIEQASMRGQGDEYYHPVENTQIASSLMGAQPYEPSGISRGENSVATSNPQNNDYVLSHSGVQSAVYEEPRENMNFIPETQPYAQATTIQPLSNFESSNPISNEQYVANNPVQNSNDLAMPMPPAMPDFSTMPMPPEIPNFDVAPSPVEQPAMGAQNSSDKIMTDQIYPNDPSQFRIPGTQNGVF